MDTVSGGGAADALLVLVRLVVRQRPPGVEEAVIQPLLALDRLAVEPSGLELARQLLRFLRQRTRSRARTAGLHLLELLGERALTRRERPELLGHGFPARTHHRQETLGLGVQTLLVAREPRQLLHRLRESATRLRSRDARAAPHQRQRRRVERIDGILGRTD